MNSKNKLEPVEYILYSVFWSVGVRFWYNKVFFLSLSNLSKNQSNRLLSLMQFFFFFLCLFLFIKRRRNYKSILIMQLLSFGSYTCFAYFPYMPSFIKILLIVTAVISILFIVMVMSRSICDRDRRSLILKRRIRGCFFACADFFAAAMSVLLIFVISLSIPAFGFRGHNYSLDTDAASVNEAQTKDNNIDTLLKLQEDIWINLNSEEKLEVLNCVVKIEAAGLGLSSEIVLKTEIMEDNLCAYYSNADRSIYFNQKRIESSRPEDVLNSCFHELYHYYQFRLADLYYSVSEESKKLAIFDSVRNYIEEFKDYNGSDDDYEDYYFQQCEFDARDFASCKVYEYLMFMEQYQDNENSVLNQHVRNYVYTE